MASPNPNPKISASDNGDEELGNQAIRLANAVVLPMALKSAIELNVLKVLSRAGPDAFLPPSRIAAEIGAAGNPDAPVLLDRLLNLLASHSILKCRPVAGEDGAVERRYGVSPICEFLTKDEDGGSVAPMLLLLQDKVYIKSWYHLNDAIMEGGVPFDREYGMNVFEYPGTDPRFNQLFSKAMSSPTTLIMKKVLGVYKGFEGVGVLVDVGGGVGVTLGMIISTYPSIKGINFDLPHVLAVAPSYPGVEHVGGDMFSKVPKGDAIFMKWVLHDWSDEHCCKLLKNCYEALASLGKVIIVESILPEVPDNSVTTNIACELDLLMMAHSPGGKERRLSEYDALAKEAGFSGCQVICNAYNNWIMELAKP
uniref:Caffeic acid O-methyltransferase n=1 Tax=Kalanchoe fedtschenkoi TaxID=63787 RepID=A0A7N0U694_KALFE